MMFEAIVLFVLTVFFIPAILIIIYKYLLVFSKPDEWMIDGQNIKAGIGLSALAWPGDQIVKFPSRVHKATFKAQQITKEMQGVEVTGVIYWTIYREKEGPFKAYKNLGNDLCQQIPSNANSTLVEMSNSIVRDQIANSDIDQILKNRSLMRDKIREKMSEIINGWGVWLETVEITDIKILSQSLFSNLQTSFREDQRLKAELIRLDKENQIKEENLKRSAEFSKNESNSKTEENIYKLKQSLKQQEENQKIYEKEKEIEKDKITSEMNLTNHSNTIQNEIFRKKKEEEMKSNIFEIDQEIIKQIKLQELEKIKKETLLLGKQTEIELFNLIERNKIELEKISLEMEKNSYSEVNMKLKTIKSIGEVVNVMNTNQDLASGFFNQMISSIKEVNQALENK